MRERYDWLYVVTHRQHWFFYVACAMVLAVLIGLGFFVWDILVLAMNAKRF